MMTSENLLTSLHKWAAHQDENFITEALASLLKYLLNAEPIAGVELVALLTSERMREDVTRGQLIDVKTQVSTARGRPDIVISTRTHLVYIEAKVESDLGRGQLKRYRIQLEQANVEKKTLILLTRYIFDEKDIQEADAHLRWSKLAEVLRGSTYHKLLNTPVGRFLVEQFTDFLYERGLTMDQVTWELGNGVRAARNLLAMIESAIANLHVTLSRGSAKDYLGFYLDSARFWIGLRLDEPTVVLFQTNEINFDPKAAAELKDGEIEEAPWLKSSEYRQHWVCRLPLEDEQVHFFARSAAGQMQTIEEFIRSALERGRLCDTGRKVNAVP